MSKEDTKRLIYGLVGIICVMFLYDYVQSQQVVCPTVPGYTPYASVEPEYADDVEIEPEARIAQAEVPVPPVPAPVPVPVPVIETDQREIAGSTVLVMELDYETLAQKIRDDEKFIKLVKPEVVQPKQRKFTIQILEDGQIVGEGQVNE